MICFSCNKTFEIEEEDYCSTKSIAYHETKINTDELLQFANESEFNDLAMKLSMKKDKEIDSIIKVINPNFTSLLNKFIEAMDEASTLGNSKEAVCSYLEKYKDYLYFPMFLDDCGPYLPVSDRGIAALVNELGYVKIGNDIVNKKTINNYKMLQLLDIAMYGGSKKAVYSTSPSWSYSYIEHTTNASDLKSKNVGQEFDSGWWEKEDRKIRVKLGRKVNFNTNPCWMQLHLDVSFRKKTWLGWLNYSSYTKTYGTCSGGYSGYIENSHEGYSSHDALWNMTNVSQCIDQLGFIHWVSPSITADLNIEYRGIENIAPLHINISSIDVNLGSPNMF